MGLDGGGVFSGDLVVVIDVVCGLFDEFKI